MGKIIPPSPTAASLGQFGNNSKGTYNGVPDISIPVLSTTAVGQNINISLSYDASGTRAAQDASWVGLGWSLAYGGGAISRTVRGLDDLYGGYHSAPVLPTESELESLYTHGFSSNNDLIVYLLSVKTGQADTEPDIFNFNFGQYNGKFVFDKSANGSAILQLESSNLKISYLDPGWKIVDGGGNSYYFNTSETATDYSWTRSYEMDFDASVYDLTDEDLNRHPIKTAWYLDSIVTNTAQKITFTYTSEESMSLLNKSEQHFKLLQMYSGTCPPAEVRSYTASRQLLGNKMPETILFDNGSIEFHKSTRTDIKGTSGYTGSSQLDYILEKDAQGSVLKKIQFYYSYFNETDYTGTNKRLKLDSIKDITNASAPLPAYKLAYFNPNSLPEKYTKSIDHWGYFNNKANTTLLPASFTQSPYYKSFTGGDRQPDTTLNSVQNGVLSSIVYPTGGTTNFTYELNQYTNLYGIDKYELRDTILSLGTLAPSDPTHTASFTLTETTELTFYFSYFDINNPYANNEFIDDYAFLAKDGTPYWTFRNAQSITEYPYTIYNTSETLVLTPGTYTMSLISLSGYNTSMYAAWQNRVELAERKGAGLRIKRIENLDGLGHTAVRRFKYDQDSVSTGLLRFPVRYDDLYLLGGLDDCATNVNAIYFARYSNSIISEGFSKGGLIGYSKVTELLGESGENGRIEYSFYNQAQSDPLPAFIPVTAHPLNGKLLAAKYYDNANHLLKKIENEYGAVDGATPGYIWGLKCLGLPFSTTGFYVRTYGNTSRWITQTKEREVIYSGTDSVVAAKSFYYENAFHKQLTKTEELSSSGETRTSQFKYSADLASSGTPNVYNAMKDRNMLDPVIEQLTYKNSNFLQASKTDYDFWKNNSWGDVTARLIVPHTAETKVLAGSYEGRIRYGAYDDEGNILSMSMENGVPKSYVWGYNKAYPIAEAINAAPDEFYVQNFEESGGTSGSAHTGKKYKSNGSAYTVSWTKPNSRDYVISYWYKASGTWHYSGEIAYTGTAYATGQSDVDDICIYPKDAQMTTYTYEPLVGITSQTDASGKTVYYEYDSFQRLKAIKDQDGNIVKAMDYHYKN